MKTHLTRMAAMKGIEWIRNNRERVMFLSYAEIAVRMSEELHTSYSRFQTMGLFQELITAGEFPPRRTARQPHQPTLPLDMISRKEFEEMITPMLRRIHVLEDQVVNLSAVVEARTQNVSATRDMPMESNAYIDKLPCRAKIAKLEGDV